MEAVSNQSFYPHICGLPPPPGYDYLNTSLSPRISPPPRPEPCWGLDPSYVSRLRTSATEVIQTATNHVAQAVQAVSNQGRAYIYGLSSEVPFDRWFYHHGIEKNLTDADLSTKIQARVWAITSLAESLGRCVIALAQYCFAKVFNSESANDNLNMLRAQWDSTRLSISAIMSPEEALKAATTAGEDGKLPIGRLRTHGFNQGTAYPS